MIWDVIIHTFILISCLLTPYDIAFPDVQQNNLIFAISLHTVDSFFFLDICISFFTAFFDEDENIVDKFKLIAINYLLSWFFIDLISIIPIDWILSLISTQLSSSGYNRIIRVLRVGKIYRLVKLAKTL